MHKKIDSVLADWSFVGVRGRRLVVEFTKNLYSVIPSRQNRNKNNFFLLNNGKIAGNIWTKYYLIRKSYLPLKQENFCGVIENQCANITYIYV